MNKAEELCKCRQCLTERGEEIWYMVLCQQCGNKRCPHATNHELECTNSNEPGQAGSVYDKVIFGFDPGTTYTGFVVSEIHGNDLKVVTAMNIENTSLYEVLNAEILNYRHLEWDIEWALESMKYYKVGVGDTTFETLIWIGEIRRQAKDNNIPVFFYHKPDWATHLTASNAKDDTSVNQAMHLRWGDAAFKKGTKGTKKKPGREAGKYSMISNGHLRSAFGVTFYHFDMGAAAKNKNI